MSERMTIQSNPAHLTFMPAVEDEIAARMEASRESFEAGDNDAPLTRAQALREVIQDYESLGLDRKSITHLRHVMVALGIYVPYDPNTVTLGGRAWDFKLDGERYAFGSWDGFNAAVERAS